MLEKTIENLTAEVKNLTREVEALSAMILSCTTALSAMQAQTPSVVAEKPAKAKPADKPEPKPEPQPEAPKAEAPSAEQPTPEQLGQRVLMLIRGGKITKPAVADLVARHSNGKTKIRDIPADKLPAFIAEVEDLEAK